MKLRTLCKRSIALSVAFIFAKSVLPDLCLSKTSLPYKKSWLITIGISTYKNLPALRYAKEDTLVFESRLKEYGFTDSLTITDKDATKKKILALLKGLSKKVAAEDRLVILYSGRTYTETKGEKKTGYLAPYDASSKRSVSAFIPLPNIKSILKSLPARHILFIVDSTISGIGMEGRRGPSYYKSEKLLNEVMAKRSVQILTGGSDFEPMDPFGPRTLFIEVLLKGISGFADRNNNGIITGNELGSYVRSRLSFESNNKQFPEFGRWYGAGEIVFKVFTKRPKEEELNYEMAFIPGGQSEMGTPGRLGRRAEKPLHTVTLEPYYMGKYEVTNSQYKKFVDSTSHRPPAYWDNPDYNQPNQPVVGVSWSDASGFCRWLGKRLPTEAEWEKAARGAEWKKFPWGSDPALADNIVRANIEGVLGKPSVVGTYKAGRSPFGVFDMSGNVWEWVYDWYSSTYYANSPDSNPTGPEKPDEKGAKVLRGGSWMNSDFVARSSYRNWVNENYTFIDIGFRCAE